MMAYNFARASSQYGTFFPTNAAALFGCWFRAASLPASESWAVQPTITTETRPLDHMGSQDPPGTGIGLVWRGLSIINRSGAYQFAVYFSLGIDYIQFECAITIATDEWHHVMYVINDYPGLGVPGDVATDVYLWYDGIPQTMTQTLGPVSYQPGYSGSQFCSLGGSPGQYWDGDIAEAFAALGSDVNAIDTLWTDDEAMELAEGRHTFWVIGDHALRPSAPQRGYYFPLDSDENPATDPMWRPEDLDQFGNRHELTLVNGPTYVNHPPLWIAGRN